MTGEIEELIKTKTKSGREKHDIITNGCYTVIHIPSHPYQHDGHKHANKFNKYVDIIQHTNPLVSFIGTYVLIYMYINQQSTPRLKHELLL